VLAFYQDLYHAFERSKCGLVASPLSCQVLIPACTSRYSLSSIFHRMLQDNTKNRRKPPLSELAYASIEKIQSGLRDIHLYLLEKQGKFVVARSSQPSRTTDYPTSRLFSASQKQRPSPSGQSLKSLLLRMKDCATGHSSGIMGVWGVNWIERSDVQHRLYQIYGRTCWSPCCLFAAC